MNYKSKWIFLSIVLGVLYYLLITVNISPIKNLFFVLNSKIAQEAKFHIEVEYKLAKLSCNGEAVLLDNSKKHDYFYRGEEEVTIALQRGENRCQAEHIRSKIKQKIGFFDFTVFFILLGIPLFGLLFFSFMKMMDWIKGISTKSISTNSPSTIPEHNISLIWIVGILMLGVIIRTLYFQKFGIMVFQHDWHGHIELIKFVAENCSFPSIPMKGWEFPQQPLYYLLTGGLYSFLLNIGFSEQDALYALGYFSLLCSIVFLFYSYRLLILLTDNRWVQLVAMIFVSLTPSMVYLSARINNDSLVLALSVLSIYYIVKSYQQGFQKGFFLALISTSLLFLTKISAAGVELLLFVLLLISYYHSTHKEEYALKNRIYWYGLIGIFLLSLTLLRVYMPLAEDASFYMVNSAKFPKQTIEALDSGYFFSFHIMDLITAGQSHVFGEDSIRFSFLTYQYGSMFFGEFDYAYFVNKSPYIHVVMQGILLFGLVYIIGLIAYIIRLRHETLLYKILFLVLLINLILVLKFIFSYPSICNTDFRYFVSSFVIFSLVFSKGLEFLAYNSLIRNIVSSILGLLVISELLFFFLLITT